MVYVYENFCDYLEYAKYRETFLLHTVNKSIQRLLIFPMHVYIIFQKVNRSTYPILILFLSAGAKAMVFNATFNNTSVLLMEETGVPKENHSSATSH